MGKVLLTGTEVTKRQLYHQHVPQDRQQLTKPGKLEPTAQPAAVEQTEGCSFLVAQLVF